MISIQDLPFKRKTYDHTLCSDLNVDQWIIPKGTVVKLAETANFGYVQLPKGCLDIDGFAVPRRLFKY